MTADAPSRCARRHRRDRASSPDAGAARGFSFTDVAREAGLTAVTVYGGRRTNKYLLETTGCGVAVLDYDNDGWLDLFFVNGTTLEGFPPARSRPATCIATSGDGTFEDVTATAGLASAGLGTGRLRRRLRQRRLRRSVRHLLGPEPSVPQSRRRHVRGRHRNAPGSSTEARWGAGCAFVDYDRDGRLDLFAANYIDFDLGTAPVPESGLCRYKGVPVACGPPGLTGGKNVLYRNTGDGTFEDVSEKRPGSRARTGTYGLGVSTLDFNDDGWIGSLRRERLEPERALSQQPRRHVHGHRRRRRLRLQPGRQAAGRHGRRASATTIATARIDIFKTNFAGDTSTLYANTGEGLCEDRTFAGGIGLNTRWLGWGVGFLDLDNDGWLDLFLVNGHVYPEVERLKTEAGYKQRKVVYRNLRNGRFEDVTERLGRAGDDATAGRGAAFADLDNDGDIDVVGQQRARRARSVSARHRRAGAHWIDAEAGRHDVEPQRHRRARPHRRRRRRRRCRKCGAAAATTRRTICASTSAWARRHRIERVEVRWPNGHEEVWTDVPVESHRHA